MKRLLPWSALLLLETLHPLRSQQPASWQKNAEAVLRFQVSQIGKDCPNAKTTMEANSCIALAGQKTKADFTTFYESLRSLLGRNSEAAGKLDSVQEQWEHYSQKACDAIDAFYRGGTIRVSAVESCRIQLMRSRMRDLDGLYSTVLHN